MAIPSCSRQYCKICSTLPAAAAAKSLQSCPTLCDPRNGSPPGSPVPGILQARTLEWVAISFSNAWKWKVKVKLLSRVRLLATPWTAAYQAPSSMAFARQEHWSGVPLPSPVKCTNSPKYMSPLVSRLLSSAPAHLAQGQKGYCYSLSCVSGIPRLSYLSFPICFPYSLGAVMVWWSMFSGCDGEAYKNMLI